jgi:acyl carrier protein
MDQIFELLQELRPDSDFMTSSDFISDFLLDSFDIITLISELEERYSIQIPIEGITPEDFLSFESIIDIVRKSGGAI